MMAAGIIINAKRIADIDVRTGNIFNHHGNIKPSAPSISEIPIKRTKGSDKFSMPVCPFTYTNSLIEKIDLQMPEYINVADIIAWRIQSIVFIVFNFLIPLCKGIK